MGNDGGADRGEQGDNRWWQNHRIRKGLITSGFRGSGLENYPEYLETIQAQRELFIDLIEGMFAAQADIWLQPWFQDLDFVADPAYGVTDGERYTPGSSGDDLVRSVDTQPEKFLPDSLLMREAIRESRVCYRSSHPSSAGFEDADSIIIGVPEGGAAQEIVLPLSVERVPAADRVASIGVILVARLEGSPFSAHDIDQIDNLAKQFCQTLQAFRRLAQGAHRLDRRVYGQQIADRVRDSAGLLTIDTRLEDVLEKILEELEGALSCDQVAIWLFEDETGEEGDPVESLQLSAIRSPGVLPVRLETGMRLVDILEADLQHDAATVRESWMLKALDADGPLIRDSKEWSVDPIGNLLGFLGDYSAISARLGIGDHVYGLLTLARHTQGVFTPESLATLTPAVNHAAIAIKNARLYESAHEQAWIATVLLEVVEAIQSAPDLSELLVTVLRIAQTVSGVNSCLLYLLEDGNTFVPAVASGLSPEQYISFESDRFSREEVPAIERMISSGQTTLLDETTEDLRLASILYAGLDADRLFADEMQILVPLTAHGEILGGILVNFAVDLLERDTHRAADVFFDQNLPIIQGIAHQVAGAIDNERLLRAQKEEAYVSVAMLQIAQAVATQRELSQTLEMIVRLTPLLLGVHRVVVYLYDPGSSVFEQVQSYGLPREFEGSQFVPQEFGMIDAVCNTNAMFAVPAIANWDETEDIQDAWVEIAVPDPSEVGANIVLRDPLVLYFPLSVQEDVFGVMVAEEADQSSGDILTRGLSLGGLRQRRLELLNGIAQQIALAVQNARLQQDTLERERLEREMQLARDIQRAFLPRTLPELSGWEVDACWRTARQVGGDFYDCFSLSGEKVALVIADVADKGMPAALYMTLSRTLLRATARDTESPADVLGRVNDLLVPDDEQGMFVTVFYAVVSLDTGEVTYANAGHNPPVWVRERTRELQMLQKGGMALGVLEGNQVEEHSFTLQAGDALILYTDGMTEAVSTGGDLFGQDRMERVIRDAMFAGDGEQLAAGKLIRLLDEAVAEFIGDAPRADDLTLLVLSMNSDDYTSG